MKKILFVTDLSKNKNHNAIEGIFNGYLKEFFEIDLIFFDKEIKKPISKDNKIIFPYHKKKEICKIYNNYDFVIVRNRFDILKNFLKLKQKEKYKIGFQLSFPHSFRRLYEAKIEKKSIFRKSIEFFIKDFYQKRIIKKCDFFLPISDMMINNFYYDLKIPYFALPLGIDPQKKEKKTNKLDKTFSFIYIGAIDKLREFDVVLKAFMKVNKNYRFDIYTPNFDYAKNILKKLDSENKKIKIYPSIKREEILKKLPLYDIGVSLIPPTILYNVSSPTKVMEYYEAKIPSLMSKIPECMEIFCHEKDGWIIDFNEDKIAENIEKILSLSKKDIEKIGKNGYEKLLEKRNYKTISKNLAHFLENI